MSHARMPGLPLCNACNCSTNMEQYGTAALKINAADNARCPEGGRGQFVISAIITRLDPASPKADMVKGRVGCPSAKNIIVATVAAGKQ
jgi:hypothetical protein